MRMAYPWRPSDDLSRAPLVMAVALHTLMCGQPFVSPAPVTKAALPSSRRMPSQPPTASLAWSHPQRTGHRAETSVPPWVDDRGPNGCPRPMAPPSDTI